jgi:hypothetical protein
MSINYFWACDFATNTGEGNLAHLYLRNNKNKKKVFSTKNFFNNTKIKKIFNYKYISPFVGVLVCWYFFLKKKKITYINYLPLWNFLIFLLLPPKTKIGPITGGASFPKNNQYIIRKYIFPILFKISERIINLRYEKILFATSLLKQYLSAKTIKKSQFNFILKYININKPKKKKIDFLIYYRKHKNKRDLFNYSFVDKICKKKLKIYIVGDKLNMQNLKNLGFVSNKKLIKLLAKTRYTLSSNENILSLFNIECINNNVKIFAEKKNIPKDKTLIKKFIAVN